MQVHLETYSEDAGNLGIRINNNSPQNSESNGMDERDFGLFKESLNKKVVLMRGPSKNGFIFKYFTSIKPP